MTLRNRERPICAVRDRWRSMHEVDTPIFDFVMTDKQRSLGDNPTPGASHAVTESPVLGHATLFIEWVSADAIQ